MEPELAWEVESLLLRIFEYGDYSFRAALRGDYSETLDCTFVLARYEGILIGAAGCLCSRWDCGIAIVGPVGVHPEYRRQGIGTRMLGSLLEYLKGRGCTAAYLGLSAANPAVHLYRKIGFENHSGIVMRLPLNSAQDSDGIDCQRDRRPSIRRACWGDSPGVSALISYAGSMYTYDLQRGLFSSKYVPPTRFLSVFPDMMKAFARHGGLANVLLTERPQRVAGMAQIRRLASAAQQHVAELDFFVHDSFLEYTTSLVEQTLRDYPVSSTDRINAYCLRCDRTKQHVLEVVGGRRIALLPDRAIINGRHVDVLVYDLRNT